MKKLIAAFLLVLLIAVQPLGDMAMRARADSSDLVAAFEAAGLVLPDYQSSIDQIREQLSSRPIALHDANGRFRPGAALMNIVNRGTWPGDAANPYLMPNTDEAKLWFMLVEGLMQCTVNADVSIDSGGMRSGYLVTLDGGLDNDKCYAIDGTMYTRFTDIEGDRMSASDQLYLRCNSMFNTFVVKLPFRSEVNTLTGLVSDELLCRSFAKDEDAWVQAIDLFVAALIDQPELAPLLRWALEGAPMPEDYQLTNVTLQCAVQGLLLDLSADSEFVAALAKTGVLGAVARCAPELVAGEPASMDEDERGQIISGLMLAMALNIQKQWAATENPWTLHVGGGEASLECEDYGIACAFFEDRAEAKIHCGTETGATEANLSIDQSGAVLDVQMTNSSGFTTSRAYVTIAQSSLALSYMTRMDTDERFESSLNVNWTRDCSWTTEGKSRGGISGDCTLNGSGDAQSGSLVLSPDGDAQVPLIELEYLLQADSLSSGLRFTSADGTPGEQYEAHAKWTANSLKAGVKSQDGGLCADIDLNLDDLKVKCMMIDGGDASGFALTSALDEGVRTSELSIIGPDQDEPIWSATLVSSSQCDEDETSGIHELVIMPSCIRVSLERGGLREIDMSLPYPLKIEEWGAYTITVPVSGRDETNARITSGTYSIRATFEVGERKHRDPRILLPRAEKIAAVADAPIEDEADPQTGFVAANTDD